MIDKELQAQLRAKYNPDGSILRKHQLRMLEMLKYFDTFCRENGIKYWLSSGTLLGAVRHGGFIPWDDDTDVEMLKEDYNKLVKLFKETDNYALQTKDNDFFYVAPYAKLRDKHSFIEEHSQDTNYKYRGIYIDVFIIEKNNKFLGRCFSSLMWRILLFGSKCKKRSIRKYVFFFLKKALYMFINIVQFLSGWLPYNKLRHVYGGGFMKNTREYTDIFPLAKIEFEGYQFMAPHDVDAYLNKLYRNHMKLPNLNNISTHLTNIKFYK